MNFDEQLNYYIDLVKCNSKELANKSGISTPVISRFRTGKKLPNRKSSQLENLANGLFLLAQEKNIDITEETIYTDLLSTFDDHIDLEQLRTNFNELISVLNINTTTLANSMGFSTSLISKIRSGQRTPFNPQSFADGICRYVVNHFKTEEEKLKVSLLLNCTLEDLSDEVTYYHKLVEWLSADSVPITNSIDHFLNHLDEFNLDEYITSIHFDEIKVPNIPFYRPTSKNYFGIQEMKQAELDFFKATVLSKSTAPVFMCNDMPMEDLAKDTEFGKKWMFAIAMTLKKGLHLNMIHNLNRPFNEMMLGLESWIPIYMTGQISPYYLKNYRDNTYCHLTYVSGTVALTGDCIKGYHSKGRYALTTSKADVAYYQTKSQCLLETAEPLMEIYREEEKKSFFSFISSQAHTTGTRRRILPTLPLHTISEELLLKILKYNQVSEQDCQLIVQSFKQERELIQTVLKENIFIDEIEELSKEEFEKSAQLLFLANSFHKNKVYYHYEDYLEHFKQTKEFANHTPNYQLKFDSKHTFRNIQIFIHEKNFVMISKNASPCIHFVIHHPKLRSAIENFIPPIIE